MWDALGYKRPASTNLCGLFHLLWIPAYKVHNKERLMGELGLWHNAFLNTLDTPFSQARLCIE